MWVSTEKLMDKADIDEIMLINNHVETATQALRPSNIDPQATQAQVDMFVLAQNRAKASYEFLKIEWINKVVSKYSLSSRNFDVNWETLQISMLKEHE